MPAFPLRGEGEKALIRPPVRGTKRGRKADRKEKCPAGPGKAPSGKGVFPVDGKVTVPGTEAAAFRKKGAAEGVRRRKERSGVSFRKRRADTALSGYMEAATAGEGKRFPVPWTDGRRKPEKNMDGTPKPEEEIGEKRREKSPAAVCRCGRNSSVSLPGMGKGKSSFPHRKCPLAIEGKEAEESGCPVFWKARLS